MQCKMIVVIGGKSMSNFNPQKLTVQYIPLANTLHPIHRRKYTLTHSDTTGQLFLAIGSKYQLNAIDLKMRDEVLAEWRKQGHQFQLIGTVYVGGEEFSEAKARERFNIFKREIDTALKGIIFGDRCFLSNYPQLLDSPIYIHFNSIYPKYNQIFYYGTPRHYLDQINFEH